MESFQLDARQLYQHIELVDPWRAEQSKAFISWCPVTDFVASRHQLQISLEQDYFPRALSSILGHDYSWGVTITAPHLWEARKDPELTAAILLEASLFARMGSSRADYPRHNWPPIAQVGETREAIRQFIRNRLPTFDGWPQLSTQALPVRCQDTQYRIGENNALWRYLAEEHARLYSQFRVVKIDFVKSGPKGRIERVRPGKPRRGLDQTR